MRNSVLERFFAVIMPLVMFFLDFICLALLQRWIVYALPVYFFAKMIIAEKGRLSWQAICGYWLLLMLQDYAMYGKFGLCLIYLIPTLIGFKYLKKVFHSSQWAFLAITIIFYVLAQAIIVGGIILGQEIVLTVTILKIFVNLIVGMLVLVGTWGNRLFLFSDKTERKVWTPNRIDAS